MKSGKKLLIKKSLVALTAANLKVMNDKYEKMQAEKEKKAKDQWSDMAALSNETIKQVVPAEEKKKRFV